MTQARARGPVTHVEAGDMMQAERRDRLLPPRNDNHRPSIHSKTAALLREQHAGGSQTARPIAVDERSSADPARSRRTTAISREPAARCGGTHGRRHAPAMGEGQGPTPWLFSSTKRPIHEKKGGEATTTLFFSCWVGFLMTTHVVPAPGRPPTRSVPYYPLTVQLYTEYFTLRYHSISDYNTATVRSLQVSSLL